MTSLGSAFTTVGGTMTKNVTLPLVGLGGAVVKAGADYEAGMSKVQAISGVTGEELDALGDRAKEMAAKTKFSTGEAAEAYTYMAMAGWKSQQMIGGLPGVMQLAAASGEDLATTSDIVTDAMTAFQMSADGTSKVLKDGVATEVDNTTRFVDVLAAASNNANTNVSMMGESFKYVAPVAGAMGYSVEDTAIALGLMANSGIKASQAGTSLRTTITNMANPTDTMSVAMQQLGVSLEDDEGNMYSLMDVMQQLRAGFGGGAISSEEFSSKLSELDTALSDGTMSEEEYQTALENLTTQMYGAEGAQKAQLAAMLAGKEGMSGLLAIVSASDEDFNKLTESIYNSNGTCEEMANIMNDNLQGAFTMLMSALNVLATSLSEYIIPALTDFIKWITDGVNAFNDLDEGTKKTIVTIAGIVAAVGPVLLILGKVISTVASIGSAIGSIIGVVTKVGGAISSLFSLLMANPIALVVAAIAGLVAAFIALWNNCEEFRNFWIGLWGGICQAADAAWQAITGFFSDAWQAIQDVWTGVGEFFSGLWDSIVEVFSGVVEFFGDLFSSAWDAITGVWDAAVGFFGEIWDGISSACSELCDAVSQFFSDAWDAIQEVWGAVVDFFTEIGEGIRSVYGDVTGALSKFFSDAWEAIKSVWDTVVSFFEGVWEGISNAFEGAAEWFGGIFDKAVEAVKGAWDGITDFFGGIWEDICGVFGNVWEKFKEIGGKIVDGIKNGILGAWDSFSTWVGNKVSGVIDSIVGFFTGGGKAKGSYASGLDYVPQDGLYQLHEGEAVLTKEQNAGRNVGGGGDTFNFYSPEPLNPITSAREMKKAKQQLALGLI